MEIKTTATLNRGEENEEKVELLNEFNFGENLDEAIQMFGEDNVFDAYVRNAKVQVQNMIRRAAETGKSEEDIEGMISNFKIGDSISFKDPKTSVKKALEGMSAEDRAAMLEELASFSESLEG